jgi:transglutaminase-like putative cysteine protease
MAMIILHHSMRYFYDRPVLLYPQTVRLYPHLSPEVMLREYQLSLTPSLCRHYWKRDVVGNRVARVTADEKIDYLGIEVDFALISPSLNPFRFLLDEGAVDYPVHYEAGDIALLAPYLQSAEKDPAITNFAQHYTMTKETNVALLGMLMEEVKRSFSYTKREEPGVLSPAQLQAKGAGSCRDLAWFLVLLLRHLGFAARFVSGYAVQPEKGGNSEKDHAELHAWTEVYLPGAGWVGLDPTAGLWTTEWYIPLAMSPNPEGAAAISGAISPCESRLEHKITVKYGEKE